VPERIVDRSRHDFALTLSEVAPHAVGPSGGAPHQPGGGAERHPSRVPASAAAKKPSIQ